MQKKFAASSNTDKKEKYTGYFIYLPQVQEVPEIVNLIEARMIPQQMTEDQFLKRVSVLNRRRANERNHRLRQK